MKYAQERSEMATINSSKYDDAIVKIYNCIDDTIGEYSSLGLFECRIDIEEMIISMGIDYSHDYAEFFRNNISIIIKELEKFGYDVRDLDLGIIKISWY